MIGYQMNVHGNWGHFRRAETNNNPLTHDFLTKTALIGLIGAVVGIERGEMRSLFPRFSDQLRYGVQINGVVKKQAWSFTLRNVFKQNDSDGKAPRPMEFLRHPDFTVAFALNDGADVVVSDHLSGFVRAVQASEAKYTPVLGLHNCPAELRWIKEGEIVEESGQYITKGFFLRSHRMTMPVDTAFRLGFERIPTYQSDNWVNLQDRYQDVIYPSNDVAITVEGTHYRFASGEEWCLI